MDHLVPFKRALRPSFIVLCEDDSIQFLTNDRARAMMNEFLIWILIWIARLLNKLKIEKISSNFWGEQNKQ